MAGEMNVITVQQPYAWAIVAGHKRVENRTFRTNYRGPLAIHAGLGAEHEEAGLRLLRRLRIKRPAELPRGVVVGLVDLVDVVRFDRTAAKKKQFDEFFDEHNIRSDPWATGPWCWILAKPRMLDRPISLTGRQGMQRLNNDHVFRELLVTDAGLVQGSE